MWNWQTLGLFAGPSDSVLPSWILTVPAANVSIEAPAARGAAATGVSEGAAAGAAGEHEPSASRASASDARRPGSRGRRW